MNSARKIKLRVTQRKPRNPLVLAAAQRKAGVHRKSQKARRQHEQRALQKALELPGD